MASADKDLPVTETISKSESQVFDERWPKSRTPNVQPTIGATTGVERQTGKATKEKATTTITITTATTIITKENHEGEAKALP